ncbi:ribonuclease N1 [Aeromicrobium ginsengisoli]|uniref:Ribonuclease N1 n=2 Tax=Aeromicrobium ginsengisoli TaxID=363867 RepID=A0A5M4FI18_9ACTN|nr:ribonuclease N1 [Aeromicrobium ginsengisoli]
MGAMRRSTWGLLVLAVVGLAIIGFLQQPRGGDDPTGARPSTAAFPPEVFETIALIESDGPFPYSRDGVVFMNREGLLPRHERGYWHEYTVPTPGESDRGARRIIAGRGGELYYTADHYRSFVRVKEPR